MFSEGIKRDQWHEMGYGYNKPLTTVCWKMSIFQLKLPITK